MLSELGFIDWVALVIAAVLLAGAASSLIIVSVAAQQRRRLAPPAPSRPRALMSGPIPLVSRSSAPDAEVIDLRSQRHTSGVSRAARADRLRRRPRPDVPPPVPAAATRSEDSVLAGVARRAKQVRRGRDGFDARSPGFFDDPIGRHEQRYWDGSRWTEHVKDDGARFIDPL